MSTTTPNMNLTTPTIGVDSGLFWEQSFNANCSILDSHNHSIGSGVQISPSGLNINSDLPFSGNNATLLRSVRFSAQGSPLALGTDIGCVYVSGVDLYYNDLDGNQIPITAGGLVNATSSGISSGTASASFSTGTLIVNAASNTPANIQCASVLLGNTGVSGSKYLTLSPPGSLVSNYNLILPAIPAQTNVMTLDTSGNMSSTTWNQVANNRTRSSGSSTEGVGGVCQSSSCGVFSATNPAGFGTPVTNLSITLTTSGRPVFVQIQPDFSVNQSVITASNASTFSILILKDSSVYQEFTFNGNNGAIFPACLSFVDTSVTAASHTYSVNVFSSAAVTVNVNYAVLVAYEL